MPIRAIVNTAQSLSYYLRQQEVAASNVASAGVPGFKGARVTARQLPGAQHPVPVHGVDLRQGDLRDTGLPLDLSLDGPGFFVVQTASGERLTRGGPLRLDGEGQLTDPDGAPLLAEEGPLVLNGADVKIEADGAVMVDGALAGRLRVVQPEDPGALLKEGGGRYLPGGALRAADPERTRVRQGAVEESNVNSLTSMLDLTNIQRAYAANVQVMKAMDGVLEIVTNQVGKP